VILVGDKKPAKKGSGKKNAKGVKGGSGAAPVPEQPAEKKTKK
jgi:hypothetical protein